MLIVGLHFVGICVETLLGFCLDFVVCVLFGLCCLCFVWDFVQTLLGLVLRFF